MAAARSTLPPPHNEGQRLLREVTASLSLSKIAEGFGVQHRTQVNAYLKTERRPHRKARLAAYAAWQIPIEAWDRLPHTEEVSAPPTAAGATNGSNGNGHRTPAADSGSDNGNSATPSALEDCLAVLAQVRKRRDAAELTASEQAKLADTETRLLTLRARLELQAEQAEDRIVRGHPAWARIKRVIVKTLAEKHPAALRDLYAALREAVDEREGDAL